jgi:acyl-CoA dehydrogenase
MEGNRVLMTGHRSSQNFYQSDLLLKDQLVKLLSPVVFAQIEPYLEQIGHQAATQMDALSLTAEKSGPTLIKRDKWGENIDAIQFHPAYWELMQIAVSSGMMRLKWEPSSRTKFKGDRHKIGFAIGLLYAMSESGQYCPLCMTDGVAHLIDQFCSEEDRERLLPHIYSEKLEDFFTGAMFLTEKAGGSDVGANLVRAEALEDGRYALFGEKWFCSNVNGQIIFALARTDAAIAGTKGLSIFLIERTLPDGSRNPIEIVRLKDKLGTRSMASGECLLNGTIGKMVGPEFQGFRVMAEMINLSRMYNSVAALAGGRRALIEAYQFLNFRKTFGKCAMEHALVRAKLWELSSLHTASFYMVWRAIQAMDRAEQGDQEEAHLLRLLTPMVKRESAEIAVYLCRESMELMGGMGYIEDTVVPKTMRDVMVLPIWEGAGNIMILDMLRASAKSQGLKIMLAEIEGICLKNPELAASILNECRQLGQQIPALGHLSQDAMEFQAKALFLRLTRCYQSALVLATGTHERHLLVLEWLANNDASTPRSTAPTTAEIEALMAWEF